MVYKETSVNECDTFTIINMYILAQNNKSYLNITKVITSLGENYQPEILMKIQLSKDIPTMKRTPSFPPPNKRVHTEYLKTH